MMQAFLRVTCPPDNDEPVAAGLDLEQVFRKYYVRLVAFATSQVQDRASAEDLVQESFVRLCNQPDQVPDREEQLKSYLYTTVRHACIDFLRHARVVTDFRQQQPAQQAAEDSVLRSIIYAEILGELHAALESLPASCRTISKMSFLENRKNQEIADELNISINTVKTQKQRALQALRLRLSPEAYFLLLLLPPQ
ncbi:MAG: RNA polymerase sigma-70 factor [Adhaeribacter sp.]